MFTMTNYTVVFRVPSNVSFEDRESEKETRELAVHETGQRKEML